MNQVIEELETLAKSMRNAVLTFEGMEKSKIQLDALSKEFGQQNAAVKELGKSLEMLIAESKSAGKESKDLLNSMNNFVQDSFKEFFQSNTRAYNDFMLLVGQKTDFVNEQIKVSGAALQQEVQNQNQKQDALVTHIKAVARNQKIMAGISIATLLLVFLSLFM
jgi:hypothetical protein